MTEIILPNLCINNIEVAAQKTFLLPFTVTSVVYNNDSDDVGIFCTDFRKREKSKQLA